MISNAKKSSSLPLNLQNRMLNFGKMKLDDELELKRIKTTELKFGSYFSGPKQSKIMEREATCTSELVT